MLTFDSRIFSRLISWGGNALEVAILFRAVRTRTLRIYSFFYIYIASTTAGVVVSLVSWIAPRHYAAWYWSVQLITLLLGGGVVLEILRHALGTYPGARRFANRIAVLSISAALLLAAGFSPAAFLRSISAPMVEFERNLRVVQAALLAGILFLIAYYGIPIGKNLRGMIFGYGIYIGSSLVTLAETTYSAARFRRFWVIMQPGSLFVALIIWLVTLWFFEPNPVPNSAIPVEVDYARFASRAHNALRLTRTYLARSFRL